MEIIYVYVVLIQHIQMERIVAIVKDLPFFANKDNICTLTDNCKKNTCLTENIPAINYDPAGKLILRIQQMLQCMWLLKIVIPIII